MALLYFGKKKAGWKEWTGPWTGPWTGLDWTGLDWTLDWNRLDWTALFFLSCFSFFSKGGGVGMGGGVTFTFVLELSHPVRKL